MKHMHYELLLDQFEAKFGRQGSIFIGPARVNLIGEHTDYNGGYVFPCALEMRSACVARPRTDGLIHLASTSYTHNITAQCEKLAEYKSLPWGSYQLGVIHMMRLAGYAVTGYDMLFDETVPHGSGLSSSAAIEMATAMAVATFDAQTTGRSIDKVALALLAQKAENEYVGMKCGIMDQFASAMGKSGHAILLKCSSLVYHHVPFQPETGGYSLVIINTNKPRSLVTSRYNERREECGQALNHLQKFLPKANCLGDITPEQFEEYKGAIRDEVVRNRAEHIVYENERTKQSCELLEKGRLHEFGKLMCRSHDSLRDLYEVTGAELDALYESALNAKGVIGARMTGAGFGGCTVNLVETGCIEVFKDIVQAAYTKKTGLIPQFYVTRAAGGAREVKI
jgi:galactokinase